MLYKVKKSQATFEVKKLAIEVINREEHRINIAKYNESCLLRYTNGRQNTKKVRVILNSLKPKKRKR